MGVLAAMGVCCSVYPGAKVDADSSRQYHQPFLQYSADEKAVCGAGLHMDNTVCDIIYTQDVEAEPLDEIV